MLPVLHWALTNPQLQAIKRIQITNLCKNKHSTHRHKKCITSSSITAGLHQMFHSPHISCCPNRLLPRPKLRNSLHKKSCNLQEDFLVECQKKVWTLTSIMLAIAYVGLTVTNPEWHPVIYLVNAVHQIYSMVLHQYTNEINISCRDGSHHRKCNIK